MAQRFDSEGIASQGWRQGAVLGSPMVALAKEHAPRSVVVHDADWLVLTSHDCDIVNASLDKEPVVEVLRLRVADTGTSDRQQLWGRNPRTLHLAIDVDGAQVLLLCVAHERWMMPRELLMQEPPVRCLPNRERQIIAEWLAKRYTRAAFPTAFDQRWRSKQKDWQRFLKRHSEWLQGVYLRLNTLDELAVDVPYQCHLMLAVPRSKRGSADWRMMRNEMEEQAQALWGQFEPGIECAAVEVLGTNDITLADVERYQRFDADWISFEDESSMTPPVVGMLS